MDFRLKIYSTLNFEPNKYKKAIIERKFYTGCSKKKLIQKNLKVKRGNEIEEESLHNLFNVRTEKEEDLKEVEQKSEEAAQHRNCRFLKKSNPSV